MALSKEQIDSVYAILLRLQNVRRKFANMLKKKLLTIIQNQGNMYHKKGRCLCKNMNTNAFLFAGLAKKQQEY
jgi:hypothetical protein